MKYDELLWGALDFEGRKPRHPRRIVRFASSIELYMMMELFSDGAMAKVIVNQASDSL
jgi:hypothetical protein